MHVKLEKSLLFYYLIIKNVSLIQWHYFSFQCLQHFYDKFDVASKINHPMLKDDRVELLQYF